MRGPWNQDFIDELEGCKGEDEKNDQADAASGGYEELAIPTGAFSSASELNQPEVVPESSPIEYTTIGDNFFGR